MGAQHTFPDSRAARIAGALFNRHSAAEIAEAIEIMVDVLDLLGGDPDLEETDTEDSFALSPAALTSTGGAGCPLADPGGTLTTEDEPDMSCAAGGDHGPGCPISDPDCAIDDGPCDTELEDHDPDAFAFPSYGFDQRDKRPWQPANDIRARKPHRDRIRRELCIPTSWGGFRLISDPPRFMMP